MPRLNPACRSACRQLTLIILASAAGPAAMTLSANAGSSAESSLQEWGACLGAECISAVRWEVLRCSLGDNVHNGSCNA